MFLVWDPNGSHAPYVPGIVRERRVEAVVRAAPLARERPRDPRATDPRSEEGRSPDSRAPEGGRGAPAYPQQPPRERPERALRARQIMSAPVVTLAPTEPLSQARELFRERRFRHVPIRAAGGPVVGVVSDRDLLRHAARPASDPVSGIMATPVLTAAPGTEIREVARVLLEERIGAMPIVDPAGELHGILTRTDILRALVRHAPFDLWV